MFPLVRTTLLVSCLLIAGRPGSLLAGEVSTVDGVVHVHNPADPPQPAVVLGTERLWEHGGDDDEIIFGVTGRILTDEDGNSYVLDQQLSEIQVFAPDGEWLRTIGREGEGPGEFRFPGDMFFTPGGHIGVAQQFPGKIIQLTRDGEPLDNFPFGTSEGFVGLSRARASGDGLVVAASTSGFNEGSIDRTAYLAKLAPEGDELVRFHEESSRVDFAELKFREVDMAGFQRSWAVGKDGRVYASLEWDRYAITVWNPDGSLDRVIHREYEPTARDDEARKLAAEGINININGRTAEIETADVERCIASIQARPDGTLWVRTDRGEDPEADGRLVTYDVLDADGHFLHQLHVDIEGDLETDALILNDQHLYVVKSFRDAARSLGGGPGNEDEEEDLSDVEPLTVTCYRID